MATIINTKNGVTHPLLLTFVALAEFATFFTFALFDRNGSKLVILLFTVLLLFTIFLAVLVAKLFKPLFILFKPLFTLLVTLFNPSVTLFVTLFKPLLTLFTMLFPRFV